MARAIKDAVEVLRIEVLLNFLLYRYISAKKYKLAKNYIHPLLCTHAVSFLVEQVKELISFFTLMAAMGSQIPTLKKALDLQML